MGTLFNEKSSGLSFSEFECKNKKHDSHDLKF